MGWIASPDPSGPPDSSLAEIVPGPFNLVVANIIASFIVASCIVVSCFVISCVIVGCFIISFFTVSFIIILTVLILLRMLLVKILNGGETARTKDFSLCDKSQWALYADLLKPLPLDSPILNPEDTDTDVELSPAVTEFA